MSDGTLASRLAELSPEGRALLTRRLASRRAGEDRVVPRRDPAEPATISFAQWRLWFLEQLRPGTNAWNTPVAVTVHGALDVDVLRDSLQLLVDRHPTLRTVFSAPGGRPVPVLLEDARVEIPVLDASGLSGEQRERAIRTFVDSEVGKPFDLASELMVRASALRTAPMEHVLVLVVHHIACDGWSKGLLLEELGAAYRALSAGDRPVLPELAIDYSDFAVWQRRELSRERLEQLERYWKERLAGAEMVLELPADRPRPARQAFAGAVQWLSVREPLAGAAMRLARAERATPFMTLMAAFKVLLHAHSGQLDLLVGSPSAMRTHPELERIVGLFANTLVYRTSLAGRPTFRELIRRVRETAIGVYGHQDLPFEKIVEAVGPPRDISRGPLVQVNLRVEGREPELRLGASRCDPVPVEPGISRFDLAIELGETDDGWAGYLEYDTALFEPATAARYAADFGAVLASAVAAPDRPIDELEPVRAVRAEVQ